MKGCKNKAADRRPGTTEALERANEILLEIRTLRAEISILERNAQEKIMRIRDQFAAETTARSEKIGLAGKALMKLMKQQKAEIFTDTDKVELVHGFLFYALGSKVIIPRGALRIIKARGWKEAIKVAESVDRGVIEKWPTKRLVAIGARREPTETFSYEVKPDGLGEFAPSEVEGGE